MPNPIPIPVLETDRLILRCPRMEDASRIQELFPRWEIVQHMSAAIPWPYPADGAQAYLAAILPNIARGTEYTWAITRKGDPNDALIGVITLWPEGPESRGFWLASAYQRQGLMKEAVVAVNDFAFYSLGMTELKLRNAEPNIASHRLKERSGAVIVDIEENAAYVGGRFRAERWRLTRDAWDQHRATFLAPAAR